MSWFYVLNTAFEQESVGPLEDGLFLAQIRAGKHDLTTVVGSPEVTGGKWCELQSIPELVTVYNLGEEQRRQEKAQQTIEKQREQQRKKQEREHQAAIKEEERRRQDEIRAEEQKAERHFAIQVASQREHARQAEQFRTETQQVFQRYWMPDYLRAVWFLNIAIAGIVVAIWWLLSLAGSVAIFTSKELEFSIVSFIFGIIPSLIITIAGVIYLIIVRLVLESFAVVFDIRGLLKRQEALLHTQNQLLHAQSASNSPFQGTG